MNTFPERTAEVFEAAGVIWRYLQLVHEPEPGLILNLMAGDLHRIIVYPSLGFQIRQEIPEGVFAALERLVSAGFGKHLVTSYSPRGEVLGPPERDAKNTGRPEGGAEA